jgi:hypothetical protein
LFAQHVAGFKGANPTMRGRGIEAAWTIGELQDLFDEWVIVGFTDHMKTRTRRSSCVTLGTFRGCLPTRFGMSVT